MNDSRDKQSGETGATARSLVPRARAVPATREAYGRLGAYTGGAGEAPVDPGFDLVEYWRVLNKRKWLIAGVAAAFLVFGAVRELMTTPLYTATVRLQIDRNVAKVVEGGNVTPLEGADRDFLRTQYELLQGRAMAERV